MKSKNKNDWAEKTENRWNYEDFLKDDNWRKDWISFDSRVIAKPIHIVRVIRDVEYQNNLAAQVAVFVKELEAMVKKIDSGKF